LAATLSYLDFLLNLTVQQIYFLSQPVSSFNKCPFGLETACFDDTLQSNGPAQLRHLWPHSVEQSAIGTAWQQPVTQYISAVAEGSSVLTVTNATQCRCGISLRFWHRI